MKKLNPREAKRSLPHLLERISLDESFTITKSGNPIAKLTPPDAAQARNGFVFGCMTGEITMTDEVENPGRQNENSDPFY